MTEHPLKWLSQLDDTIAPADFLIELRRIADSLEAFTGRKACDGVKNAKPCVLDPNHVGHHASGDGRLHWLDED
jgi:hypothetical protein